MPLLLRNSVAEHRPPDPAQTEKVRRWIKDVEEATKAKTTPSNVHADMEAVTETDADPFAGLEGSSKPPSEVANDDSDDALDVDTTSLKTSDINSVVTTADQPSRFVFVVLNLILFCLVKSI